MGLTRSGAAAREPVDDRRISPHEAPHTIPNIWFRLHRFKATIAVERQRSGTRRTDLAPAIVIGADRGIGQMDLYHQLRPKGVYVVLLQPGTVATQMSKGAPGWDSDTQPAEATADLAARPDELGADLPIEFRLADGRLPTGGSSEPEVQGSVQSGGVAERAVADRPERVDRADWRPASTAPRCGGGSGRLQPSSHAGQAR